jgi:hypothetical protein
MLIILSLLFSVSFSYARSNYVVKNEANVANSSETAEKCAKKIHNPSLTNIDIFNCYKNLEKKKIDLTQTRVALLNFYYYGYGTETNQKKALDLFGKIKKEGKYYKDWKLDYFLIGGKPASSADINLNCIHFSATGAGFSKGACSDARLEANKLDRVRELYERNTYIVKVSKIDLKDEVDDLLRILNKYVESEDMRLSYLFGGNINFNHRAEIYNDFYILLFEILNSLPKIELDKYEYNTSDMIHSDLYNLQFKAVSYHKCKMKKIERDQVKSQEIQPKCNKPKKQLFQIFKWSKLKTSDTSRMSSLSSKELLDIYFQSKKSWEEYISKFSSFKNQFFKKLDSKIINDRLNSQRLDHLNTVDIGSELVGSSENFNEYDKVAKKHIERREKKEEYIQKILSDLSNKLLFEDVEDKTN